MRSIRIKWPGLKLGAAGRNPQARSQLEVAQENIVLSNPAPTDRDTINSIANTTEALVDLHQSVCRFPQRKEKDNMKEPNRLTPSLHEIHPGHYLLHAISGLIVFAACVVTDVAVIDMKSKAHKHVIRWQGGQIETVAWPPTASGFDNIPPQGAQIETGVRDDGLVVWRRK